MTIKSGQVWSGITFCTDSVGALTTPSVGPVGHLYVNGVVNAATVTITGTNPYKYSVTLPDLEEGDKVSLFLTATIALVATAEQIDEEISADY